MKNEKPIVAIMYDFDNTLSTKDMQEFDFIPRLGMTADEFWDEANTYAGQKHMDGILAVLYLMLQKSKDTDLCTRESLKDCGKNIEFCKGVETWFERINSFAAEQGVQVEHYIISSGLKPMIEGSKIGRFFKEIYACDYIYDEDGYPLWPAVAVNYTSKVQFLYRIHKGVFDVGEDDELNSFTPEEEKHVSFSNMIYIGDGMTDIPCMKLTRLNGGHSIGVYKPHVANQYLIKDDRVDFLVPADYSSGSEIEQIMQTIILKLNAESRLERITKEHTQRILMQEKKIN